MAQMNLFTKQKEPHRDREQICGFPRGWEREWDGWGVWHWQMQTTTFIYLFIYLFIWAAPEAYGDSQARGPI